VVSAADPLWSCSKDIRYVNQNTSADICNSYGRLPCRTAVAVTGPASPQLRDDETMSNRGTAFSIILNCAY
jgi:hypothetical protein